MVAPEVVLSAPALPAEVLPLAVSVTDPPRDGEPPEQYVRGVEEQGEDDDAERAREDLVERVGAAQRGDAAEDLVAQAGARGVRGDGGDAHQHLGGDPDAGEDRRPGERQ